jgi:hypothetical protein
MSKVVVLWDIDGTLNVNGRVSLWSGQWLTDVVTRDEAPALFEEIPERFRHFDLRVNSELLNSIAALDEHPNVENGWLTAWEEEARTIFSPRFNFPIGEEWLTLKAAPGEFTLDPTAETIWWKTQSLRQFLEMNPDIRVIWVDDLIDSDFKTEFNNRKLNEDFPGRVAMVGVYAFKGVTPDSFNFIKRLATERWQAGMFIFE